MDDLGRDWKADAACTDVPIAVFFPGPGEPDGDAKLVCGQCPVRRACLEYALAGRERYGVWGGKSETQRRRILRDRHGVHLEMERGKAMELPQAMELPPAGHNPTTDARAS